MEEYGLDYAMHRHDIERLEVVPFYGRDDDGDKQYKNMVNLRLTQGWKPLHMTSYQHGTSVIMGVPRPKECSKHLDTIKAYYIRDDEWYCPECLEEQD